MRYIKNKKSGGMFKFNSVVCQKFIKKGGYEYITEKEYRNYMIKLQIINGEMIQEIQRIK